MNSLSSQTVVEVIAMQLAQRRHQMRVRQARQRAYQTLARTIAFGPSERASLYALDPHRSIRYTGQAAAA
jgi:hypothetical protein